MEALSGDAALAAVLGRLDAAGYDFVTPTPSTVRRWLARSAPERPGPRDVLGWGFPFREDAIDQGLVQALKAADLIVADPGGLRCTARAARIHGRLFLHTAFPGAGDDAVFIGPDSYRFADLIRREIGKAPVSRILDIGTGAGVGAILAGLAAPWASVTASDVNPAALRLARANAAHAGLDVVFQLADGLPVASEAPDLIIANPPYVAGESGRTYKDGGGDLGERLALDWAAAALERLTPGGRMILYTGSPVLSGGRDVVREGLEALVGEGGFALDYAELDPDVFSGELRRAPYADVERIAAVGAVLRRPV